MQRENRFITIVHLLNKKLNKCDQIEYDVKNKEFVFGSVQDYYITDGDNKGDFIFSIEQEKTIRNCYKHGLSATGAQYYLDEDDPTKLYYSSADINSVPRVIYDSTKPYNVDKSFIDDTIEEPIIIPVLK